MEEHKVGDLVHSGFGLGAIVEINQIGDCYVEWYCKEKNSLRTRFYHHEIMAMKKRLLNELS